MNRTWVLSCLALVALVSTPLVAESVVGAERFICAVVSEEICTSYEACTVGGPSWDTGIPEFLEFDVKKQMVGTTEAGGNPRQSKVTMRQGDGLIAVQGYERGKSFAVVVNEETGAATASVTTDGEVISVFLNCTPK
ncbi:MAG: hypothetical protein GY716_16590 [bacterium]|nr:hypothetical protein [bacterium]